MTLGLTVDSATENSVTPSVYTSWTSGNDGAGSGLDADLLAVVTLAKLDIMRGIRMISAAVDQSNILLFQRYGSGNIMQPAYELSIIHF